MITLNQTTHDDPQFIGIVSTILNSTVTRYRPHDVYVVEIDHCFDRKWQKFSGKVLGALGTWNKKLVVPPFEPHRVVSQRYFRSDMAASSSYLMAAARPLHIEQHSGDNRQRYLSLISRSGLFLWYSGETLKTDQASVLLYQIDAEGTSDWFASFIKSGQWKLNKVRGIPQRALQDMMNGAPTIGI
ncbi:MAG: hypothetical protein QOC96_945 [Acidobacteriota bacterium]|jgi:hypothetical protein|nr:hypothetical protein [Acidobacteriota bacterium]